MFRSTSKRLDKIVDERKDEIIVVSADPACEICKCCWYQGVCLRNILLGNKPITCCIYQLFSQNRELILEEVVKYVCGNKCVERQTWKGDPVPHTPYYCEHYCPMSRFLKKLPAKEFEEASYHLGY